LTNEIYATGWSFHYRWNIKRFAWGLRVYSKKLYTVRVYRWRPWFRFEPISWNLGYGDSNLVCNKASINWNNIVITVLSFDGVTYIIFYRVYHRDLPFFCVGGRIKKKNRKISWSTLHYNMHNTISCMHYTYSQNPTQRTDVLLYYIVR